MKILSIEPMHRKKDNKAYWKVTAEGKELPILFFDKPAFGEGDDVELNLQERGEGDRKYLSVAAPKAVSTHTTAMQYPKKTNDRIILWEVCLKGAIELETTIIPSKESVDIDRVMRNTQALYSGSLKVLEG